MKKDKKYTINAPTCGNFIATGVYAGSIGAIIARLGGNDKEMEELLINKKVVVCGHEITLTEEVKNEKSS